MRLELRAGLGADGRDVAQTAPERGGVGIDEMAHDETGFGQGHFLGLVGEKPD